MIVFDNARLLESELFSQSSAGDVLFPCFDTNLLNTATEKKIDYGVNHFISISSMLL